MYPKRFDVIWGVKPPYDVLDVVGSEGITGLDDRGCSEEGVGGIGPVVGAVGEDEIGSVTG